MKTEEMILNNLSLGYPLERLANKSRILFLDIETTGFLSGNSAVYLIGCAYFEYGNWVVKQFFASTEDEEEAILNSFFSFAEGYDMLIHYNGNSFDLPFLKARAEKYNIQYDLDKKAGLDIYRRIYTYRNLLKLPDCRLKTIEQFLDVYREDRYNGGELISVYNDYLTSHDYGLYNILISHNSDDMVGMLKVLPILSYYDLLNEPLTAAGVNMNSYNDLNGIPRRELVIEIHFESTLPKPFSFMGRGCHFKAEGNDGVLVIPLYDEELKYFYANYKDYYYLPLEDMAVHKSIATYVDKEFREQAKASNCYTRKISTYLPQWTHFVTPFFKRSYESKDLYFELTDDIKKDRELFSAYASHVINAIAFQN